MQIINVSLFMYTLLLKIIYYFSSSMAMYIYLIFFQTQINEQTVNNYIISMSIIKNQFNLNRH